MGTALLRGAGGGTAAGCAADVARIKQWYVPVATPSARRVVHGWSVDGGRGEGVLVGTDVVGKGGLLTPDTRGRGRRERGGGSIKTSKESGKGSK